MLLSAIISIHGKTDISENIGRCLYSLLPLADALPSFRAAVFAREKDSEDITVPAGYEDRFSVIFAKNPAKARREFVESSAGGYCLFLGSDCVLTEHEDIIRFFRSGECEKYGSAALSFRTSRKGAVSEYYSAALVRITENNFSDNDALIRFMYFPPVKLLASNVITGGAPADEEFSLSSLRYLGYAEALRDSDRENAYRHISAGMYLCPEKRRAELIPFYVMKARLLYEDGYYEDTVSLCKEYFEDISGYCVSDAEMYRIMGSALEKSGRSADAGTAFEKYAAMFSSVLRLGYSSPHGVICACNPDGSAAAECVLSAAKSLVSRKDHEKAAQILDIIPISLFGKDLLSERLELETVICGNLGYERAEDIFRRLPKKNRRIFSEIIRKKLSRCSDKKEFSAHLSELYFDDPLIEDITAIYSAHYNCGITEMFAKADISQYPELLFFAVGEGLDISGRLAEDLDKTRIATDFIFENFPEAPAVFASYDIEGEKTPAELTALTLCFERAAHYAVYYGDIPDGTALFEMFCGFGSGLAAAEYGDEIISDDITDENVPDGLKKYIFGEMAVRYFGEHRYLESVKALRKMISVSPESALVIGAYNEKLRFFRAKHELMIRAKEAAFFSRTAKYNIRYRLRHGDIGNALAFAAEYMRIAPLDPELNQILAESGIYIIDESGGIKQ